MPSITFTLSGVALLGLSPSALAQAPAVDAVAYESAGPAAERRAPRSAGDPQRLAPPTRIALDPLDAVSLLAEDERTPPGSPLRVGIVRDLVPIGARDGMWTPLEDGAWVWSADFESPGARGLRLRVRGFDSKHTGELRVLDLDEPSEFVGPFLGRERGELWTPTLHAERVRVEYEIADGTPATDEEPRFVVDAILHRYRPPVAPDGNPGTGTLPCHLDINCYPQWLFEGAGVGQLYWVSNGSGWVCSGGLLNRIPSDFSPLFMTANHCAMTAADADSAEIQWFFRTESCGSSTITNSVQMTEHAAMLVADPSTDFRLLGLIEPPPGGTTFLGWDASYWGNGSASTVIHHPGGTLQRISFGTKWENLTSCVGGDSWRVRYLQGDGPLEGGSSGAPVLDASGRVRGTHSCSASVDCAEHDNGWHGRFDLAFARLAPYLNPVDPIYASRAYSGTERGTQSQPFNTLTEASFAVIAGSTVWLSPGTYAETPTISKPMRLRTTGGDVVIGG